MKIFIEDESIIHLVNTYSNTLFRVAYQSVRVVADAEDIVQDVLMSALNHFPFDSEEHLKAWLIRATINKSKNILNSASHKKNVQLDDKHFLIPAPVDEKGEYPKLISAIEKLPPTDRHLVYLFYYEECSVKEIAAIFKKSENSIFIKLTRVRAKLKKYLEDSNYNE